MKWNYKPVVHFRLWTSLLAINLGMAALCTWMGVKYGIYMEIEIIFFIVMSLLSFAMTRVWQRHIDNPDDYEKLQQARLRRLSGRDGRTGRKREDKKKDSKE